MHQISSSIAQFYCLIKYKDAILLSSDIIGFIVGKISFQKSSPILHIFSNSGYYITVLYNNGIIGMMDVGKWHG
jgi:hypothetical protein